MVVDTIGFIDESMRREANLYVMAVVVVAGSRAENASQSAQAVLLPGQSRFHWRSETETQRGRMLNMMVELGVTIRGYVCRTTPARFDRGRALCLRQLLWDLSQVRIDAGQVAADRAVIESREDHNDAKDRRTILGARQAGWVRKDLAYGFERPRVQPLLWLADAAAGAISAQANGEDDHHALVLKAGGHLIISEIDP